MKKVFSIDINRWHPLKTIECGQYFHWTKKDDAYFVVFQNEYMKIVEESKETIFYGDIEDEDKWCNFLSLNDLKGLDKYSEDKILKPIIKYGQGLQLLKQDPFVTIISFILSSNNHFARIQKGVNGLSKKFGEKIGENIYTFPSPETLAGLSIDDIRKYGNAGYRDKYIKKTSEMIVKGEFNLYKAYSLNADEAKKYLMKLSGVGPKVADCIILFAYQKEEAFPVDIWMHRVMEEFYYDREMKREIIAKEARERFKEDSGLIQQYLFYYSRDHKIGS